MAPPSRCALLTLLVLGTPTTRGAAQDAPDTVSAWKALPTRRLFPIAVANPAALDFGAGYLNVFDTDIPNSGSNRVELRMGGQFGVVRWRPERDRGWSTQFSVEGGFSSQFDSEYELDNIGWDGLFGFALSAASADNRLALELAMRHTSSHVGDEYAERTGRTRLEYTREEIATGVSWRATRDLRLYGGVGYAFKNKNDSLQAPWRVSAGAEYFKPGWFWHDRGGWYVAVDGTTWEERDWNVDFNAQLGLFCPSGDRRYRTALGYHSGRVPIGEFFQSSEQWVSLGVYLDL